MQESPNFEEKILVTDFLSKSGLKEKSSCPEYIKFITEDYFVQHMNITIIYN